MATLQPLYGLSAVSKQNQAGPEHEAFTQVVPQNYMSRALGAQHLFGIHRRSSYHTTTERSRATHHVM